MSIVLKKDGHTTAPINDFDEAQKLVNEGWEVWINKTGNKLVKQGTPKATPKNASKKKVEDE